jgi:hypothetical protein
VRLDHTLHGEVQDLLDQLAHAIVIGDGESAADLWETPGFVIGADVVMAIAKREELVKFFGAAREQYNAKGVVKTRADLLDLERVGSSIVIAAVRWPWIDASGREVGSESSDYTLRRDRDGRLRVRSVLMRGLASGG